MAIETTIHTIRHAETEYNTQQRYAGSIDVPLSENGLKDTKLALGNLENFNFDVIITSALKRAIQTAEIMAQGEIPVIETPICNERNFGEFQGLTWDEARNLEPKVLFIQVGGDAHSVNPRGAEPFEEVWERAKKLKKLIFEEYGGKSVLVVSHGVFLQQFHGVLWGFSCIESLAISTHNLELTTFSFKGEKVAGDSSVQLVDRSHISW